MYSPRYLFNSLSLNLFISFKETEQHSFSPNLSSGIPKTLASRILGCLLIASSTSRQEMFSPPLITISFALSTINKKLSLSKYPRSPDLNHSL